MVITWSASHRTLFACVQNTLVLLLFVWTGYTGVATAGWDPITGVKDGNDHATESSILWTGTQLAAFGGILDFVGSASVNGPILLQEQNGWSDPIVNVASSLYMIGTDMSLLDGAQLTVQGATPGMIQTATLTILGGSSATVGSMSVSNDVRVSGMGSNLHTVGNYQQSAGVFQLTAAANFRTDGTFDFTGLDFTVVDGSTFSVGNLSTGAVQTGTVTINQGSSATVGPLTASDSVRVSGTGSNLHTVGNYQQSAGVFQLTAAANFAADGTFNFEGSAFELSGNAGFHLVGGPAAVGSIAVDGATSLLITPRNVCETVSLRDDGTTVSLIGDITTNGSLLKVENGRELAIAGYLGEASSARSTLQVLGGSRASSTVGIALDGELRVAGPGSELETHFGLAVGLEPNPIGMALLIFEESASVEGGTFDLGYGDSNVSVGTIRSGAHLNTTATEASFGYRPYSGIAGGFQNAIGTLTIQDAGTRWDSAHQIQVGRWAGSNGTFKVLDGAIVVSAKDTSLSGSSGIIGGNSGATGRTIVSGVGSLWTQNGGLSAGFNGHGTLEVRGQGSVESEDGFVARFPGSAGEATVSGIGSGWHISRALYVGGNTSTTGGVGELDVVDQGVVLVGQRAHVWSGGTIDVSSSGIMNIGAGPQPLPGTIRIGPGGTLGGDGTVIGNVLVDGGTISPGSSPGMLRVLGNVQNSSATVLRMEINGTTVGTGYDQLHVTGAVSLAGTLEVPVNDSGGSYSDPLLAGEFDQFALIVGSSISGTFETLAYDGAALPLTFTGSGMDRFHVGSGLFRILDYDSAAVELINYRALPGDANGDGAVDGSDFGIWNAHKFTSSTDWSRGDFNGDGITDGSDFNIWNANKFTGVSFGNLVPEPGGPGIIPGVLLPVLAAWRRFNAKRQGRDGSAVCTSRAFDVEV
jgi:T5SS/PEP-CTERM-associated repeat protein